MGSHYTHLSDEELLLFADGELSVRQISGIKTHLTACWDCRARLRQIEETISDFLYVHHRTLDPQLPPSTGPRALLKARLTQAGASVHDPWFRRFQWAFAGGKWVYAGAMILVVAMGTTFAYHLFPWRPTPSAAFLSSADSIPDRRLTPGAVRPVSTSDVCTVSYSDDAGRIPAPVRQTVFSEYGIHGAPSTQANAYELDYLISPQLGGSDDIRNLWPEPTSSTDWNLRVKDELEDRLHQLVCQGKLNLSTAQADLATNWIAAYKRYFHTDRPIQPL